ncbi:hypothetical protein HOLleu_05850 [Holothuria leucospilota]|uniref:Uncharacterized protein n=1 Tax=Holothuria leucospilota TaxID=206669 RepID=A0A9Q1CL94_HOLLE|nr:hypothetical protein HOLleu_05850 [Holothuria leucospilota]
MLRLDKLLSYFPFDQPPHVEAYQMYEKLRKVNSREAIGLKNIPYKLIREFACEFSAPDMENIFNYFLKEGKAPLMWMDTTVIPMIPKEKPAIVP